MLLIEHNSDFFVMKLIGERSLEVIETCLESEDIIFTAFKFDGEAALVTAVEEGTDALLNGNVTVTYDSAAEVVAASGAEPAHTGEGKLAVTNEEVFYVNVNGIREKLAYCFCGIVVSAEEVTHIEEKTEVIGTYGVEEFFNAVAVLTEGTVVFEHGLDAESFSVIGNAASAGSNDLDAIVKTAFGLFGSGVAAGDIVSHAGNAEGLRNSELFFEIFELFFGIVIKKVCADGIGRNSDIFISGISLDFFSLLDFAFSFGSVNIDKFDCRKAEFFCFIYNLENICACFAHVLTKTVRANAYFHDCDLLLI